MVRVQYPGNPPQSHRWAINPAALRIVAGLNLGDTVSIVIAMADMQAVFDEVMFTIFLANVLTN